MSIDRTTSAHGTTWPQVVGGALGGIHALLGAAIASGPAPAAVGHRTVRA